MSDSIVVDFISVGEGKSGDAIAACYKRATDAAITIHVTDGGYSADGEKLVEHINQFYGQPARIEHVVLTHPDNDHASGLVTVLETFAVGVLWMNRPWLYVDQLLPRFEYKYTREGLIQRLKEDFFAAAELEKTATEKGIAIREAFQGQQIGAFTVLSPTLSLYLDLVVESEKTPKAKQELGLLPDLLRRTVEYVSSLWGAENLKGDSEGTSPDNEMSIIQYSEFNGKRLILTGDAGVRGLTLAHSYLVQNGLTLPGGIALFQAPHHGSRRNLSTDVLNKWFGEKLAIKPEPGQHTFNVVVSAHRDDEHHPKKATVRAFAHRGGGIATTEKAGLCWSEPHIMRPNWHPAEILVYPDESEV